jgi:hypothetical protein
MVQFISPQQMNFNAGTWTLTMASNVISQNHTAGADTPGVFIPITLPGNSANFKGSYLTSIDVVYSVGTADLTDFATVELEKQVIPATGSAQTATTPAITCDAGHNTAALRKVQGNHTMTVNLTTPVWIGAGDAYTLYLYISAAATSVLKIYGARAYFTKRL